MSDFTPAKTALSRVWLIEGRAHGDHTPALETCLRMTGVSQGLGDIEKIECPDPDHYGSFVEVGSIRGSTERVTTSLEGRYALDLKSTLLRLARKGCAVDVQLHMGDCEDPKNFNDFKKVLVLEDAYLTNWSTEDLGALASGDNAGVNETADISAKLVYEVIPISFAERATSIVTNEVVDVVICDTLSCGECTEESDGCQKVYAITLGAGGSPGTPPDLLFSPDAGATWYAYDIDSLGAAENPDEIDCVGEYLVVVSQDSCSLHYVLKSTVTATTAPDWTEVTTGFVAAGCPTAIKSVGSYAFIVGDGGYIYGTDDPTAGVDVLDAGVATGHNLLDVDALSDAFAVAVGTDSAIVKTEDGITWALVTPPPTGAGVHYNAILVRTKDEWIIGTSTGNMYLTLDAGVTWTLLSFSGAGAGSVRDIVQSTDSVLYMAHSTATPRGRIFRSIDGGHSWTLLPDGSGTIPVNDRVNALAVCEQDPNFVVGVGLADNAADGFVVVGNG